MVSDRPSFQLTVIPNPFEGAQTRRETIELMAGQTLGECLPEQVRRDPSWIVIEQGRLIPREEWAIFCALPDSELLCLPRPEGNMGMMVGGALLGVLAFASFQFEILPAAWAMGVGAFGAALAVNGAASLLIGAPRPSALGLNKQGGTGSPTYNFNGIQNSTRPGAPIPIVYGTHRVGGAFIELFTKTQADNDVLYALLALSEGPIQAVSSIMINGQPASAYRNLTTNSQLGANAQTAIALFGDHTLTAFAAVASITPSALSYTTIGVNLTAFELLVTFPQGLYAVSDQGGLGQTSVTLKVQYQLVGAISWTAAPDTTITDSKRAVLRQTIRVEGLTPGQYIIQIWRTTPESTDLQHVDAVQRATVNEIVNDAYIYPNIALLAVQAVATDQISGGVPTITSIVQGLQLKVFTSVTQYAIAWSNNPSWIVFDMLTNPRYGMGQFVWPIITTAGTISVTNGSAIIMGSGTTWLSLLRPGLKIVIPATGIVLTISTVNSDTQFTATTTYGGATASGLNYEAHRDDLDIQSFIDWAMFCDTLVSDGNGGTEKRATCDIVFDASDQKLWDAVLKVCGLGLATLVKLGNYLRVRFQQASTPVQLFCMANIVRGSFKEDFLPLKERANYFEVAFLNAANDYRQEMVTLEDPLIYTNSEQVRKQTIEVFGCTRSSHAGRLARFHQLSNRYITRTIEFEVGIDAIACEPGDVINFQHDVPQWGTLGSRAASGATSTITLDAPVTLVNGVSYQILVRHNVNDTVETQTITSLAGTYAAGAAISIAPATWATIPADGDVIAIGQVTPGAVKPFRIVAIVRTNDFNGRITAVEYNAAIYDETGQLPVNVVNYSTLPDPMAPPAQVMDLTLSQLNDATQTVWVSFTPPTDSRFQTAKIYRTDSGRPVLIGESSTGHFGLANIPIGQTVTITVVSISRWGSAADFNAAPSASLTVKTSALPPNVTGLELVGQGNNTNFVGRDAKFRWKDRARTNGVGLEPFGQEALGAGAGTTDPFFKNYRIEIYNTDGMTMRRREYVVDPLYIYSYEKNYEDGQRIGGSSVRSFTLKVWQQDIFNQISAIPAMLTVSNPAPAILSNFTARATAISVLAHWDKAPEIDIAGYVLYRSTSSGFTPGPGTLIYDGPSTVFDDQNLTIGTTYYYVAAAYDTFDKTTLNYSGQISAAPSGLAQSQFFPGLHAIEIVSVLPTVFTNYPNGAVVALTTDSKLYRSTGSAWTTAVPSVDITGQITTTQITDLAISTPKLAAGAVTAATIAANTITAAQIAANSLTTATLAAGAVTTTQITDLAISTPKLAAGAVTAATIAANTITAAQIAANSLTTATLAAGAVTTTELAANAVTSTNIAAGAVIAGKIAANTITAAGGEIANATIGTAKIINAAVGTAQIANAAITTALIASAAVGTAQIANAAITTALIASAAVGTAQIANAAITNALIGSLAVATANIQDLQVTTVKIASNSVTNRGSASAIGPTNITPLNTWIDLVTISLTTSGGSVILVARAQPSWHNALNNTLTGQAQIVRDATVIDGPLQWSISGGTVLSYIDMPSVVCEAIDSPAAGTYTYKFQMQKTADAGNSANSLVANYMKLIATEYLK